MKSEMQLHFNIDDLLLPFSLAIQRHPHGGVFKKRCSENSSKFIGEHSA